MSWFLIWIISVSFLLPLPQFPPLCFFSLCFKHQFEYFCLNLSYHVINFLKHCTILINILMQTKKILFSAWHERSWNGKQNNKNKRSKGSMNSVYTRFLCDAFVIRKWRREMEKEITFSCYFSLSSPFIFKKTWSDFYLTRSQNLEPSFSIQYQVTECQLWIRVFLYVFYLNLWKGALNSRFQTTLLQIKVGPVKLDCRFNIKIQLALHPKEIML